jgi:hypothetical protein
MARRLAARAHARQVPHQRQAHDRGGMDQGQGDSRHAEKRHQMSTMAGYLPAMSNPYGITLDDASLRWAAAEGVPEAVIAAISLLPERSTDEIVANLSPVELEHVFKILGRSPRGYPPGATAIRIHYAQCTSAGSTFSTSPRGHPGRERQGERQAAPAPRRLSRVGQLFPAERQEPRADRQCSVSRLVVAAHQQEAQSTRQPRFTR